MAQYTGGCLCGAIRFEINGEPVRAAHCHCDDCRKATGSSFATNAFFKEGDLTVLKGKAKRFEHKADSGATMIKGFCDKCGSQVFNWNSAAAGVVGVKVGTIDDVGSIRPQIEVFTSKKLPFIRLADETEHFERMRPR